MPFQNFHDFLPTALDKLVPSRRSSTVNALEPRFFGISGRLIGTEKLENHRQKLCIYLYLFLIFISFIDIVHVCLSITMYSCMNGIFFILFHIRILHSGFYHFHSKNVFENVICQNDGHFFRGEMSQSSGSISSWGCII